MDNTPTDKPKGKAPRKSDGGKANHERGKLIIKDMGAELARQRGNVSLRTDEMEGEILSRLWLGETLLSISLDDAMPAYSTLMKWQDDDPEFEERIERARIRGTHVLHDLQLDIAQGGFFSTGDVNRDRLLIESIRNVISKRNRAYFGETLKVDQTMRIETVVLPTFALGPSVPKIEAGEFVELDGGTDGDPEI